MKPTLIAILILLAFPKPAHTIEGGVDYTFKAKPEKPLTAPDLSLQATLTSIYIPPVNTAPANCGDNSYANYIYSRESGCSTIIQNSSGCLGIGQACPASKLLAVCPNEDYPCENSFFTNYANTVYGGWYNAYLFWIAHSWW